MCIILHVNINICILCLGGTVGSMNNLNDPPRWNIAADPVDRRAGAGGGDGSSWNYALLVPMLGLAAFRKDISRCIYL